MFFHKGQEIWVNFPGNRVKAVVLGVGNGEVKILENDTTKAEWVPVSWCSEE